MQKNIEDSIKDGLIIRATTMGVVYVIKPLKPPSAIELAGAICTGVLVKDYAVYKK